jgi:glutaredoxin
MKKGTYTSFILILCTIVTFAQQKKIEFSTQKKDGILSVIGSNHTDDDLEITLTIKDIKMLKGYTKPVTKLVKSKSKLKFIDLTYEYDIYNYKLSYAYKKPETKLQEKLRTADKSAFILKDLSKINEGIVVFDDDGCGRCRLVTNYLIGNDIDFRIISLAGNEKNQKLMWKTIKEKGASLKVKAPVVIVNGNLSHSHPDLEKFLSSLN